jgi:hypothetical protein
MVSCISYSSWWSRCNGDDVMANLYDNMRKAKKKKKRGKKTAGVKPKVYKQMKNKTGPFKKKKTAPKKKRTYRRKK